ncbi:hypothetical protein [Niabella hibiscisoli]|uniref:hypothetical protein n=1 Tax=Niabella hibiscisoli TaxID=1825928 RepID=UPI001F111B98|nr:hypothetical protein [Niabella hibiscisoli]MCH5716428.1 hypothetical protein [Niabella hibiscisoli]
MTKDDFLKLLRHSSTTAYDFAKNYVIDDLPNNFKYSVILNASSDDHSLTQFDIYPNDNDKQVELIKENEVAELLCRKDKVPVWIDIAVECVYKRNTIFKLLCAGRYSDNPEEFYYTGNGTGPFGVKSPNLPFDYVDGNKFELKKIQKVAIKLVETKLKCWE